jgi:hypothetical protein
LDELDDAPDTAGGIRVRRDTPKRVKRPKVALSEYRHPVQRSVLIHERPRQERVGTDRPRNDRFAADKPRTERATERPRTDRFSSDRPRTERPYSDKPRTERSFWEVERSFLNGREFRDLDDFGWMHQS